MDYLYIKLCAIEDKINTKNKDFFQVILNTQKLTNMIENKEFIDIKECLVDLIVYDITKCLKKDEKLEYRFNKYGIETPTPIYNIEFDILCEIRLEIIKELGL